MKTNADFDYDLDEHLNTCLHVFSIHKKKKNYLGDKSEPNE